MGSWRVGHDWATSLSRAGEGSGSPLQCSCLENPRDGRAWWAAVYGVSQSQTRLKRLSSRGSSRVITKKKLIADAQKLKMIQSMCANAIAQLYLTVCNPMDCSLPGSSVYEIFQARILKWQVATPIPGDLPNPGIKPAVLALPAMASRFFTTVLPGKPSSKCTTTNSKRRKQNNLGKKKSQNNEPNGKSSSFAT